MRREGEVLVAEGVGQRPDIRGVKRAAVLEEVNAAAREVEVSERLLPALVVEARHPFVA